MNFPKIIKTISIFWSLIFQTPVLMVLKFWRVKYLILIKVVLIRWYCMYFELFVWKFDAIQKMCQFTILSRKFEWVVYWYRYGRKIEIFWFCTFFEPHQTFWQKTTYLYSSLTLSLSLLLGLLFTNFSFNSR